MTKEQEEAIDRINKSYDDNTGYYDASGRDWITILNLINHLQEENEYIHTELDKQQTTINNYAKEIEKKDKVIDLMAEFIKNNTLNNVLIGNVCLKLKCNNEECHEDNWEECIKQYFERKATNDA